MSLFRLFKFIHDIFKFHVFVKQFYQIKHTSTLKHVCQVLVLHLIVLNLTIIFKIRLQWKCLPTCSYLPLLKTLIEKPSTKKLKSKHRGGLIVMF